MALKIQVNLGKAASETYNSYSDLGNIFVYCYPWGEDNSRPDFTACNCDQ